MLLRGVIIMAALALASVDALPPATQAAGAPMPSSAAVADASRQGHAEDGHPARKVVRRCARRSRLGICERWNMPKSAVPQDPAPGNGSDSRKSATKH